MALSRTKQDAIVDAQIDKHDIHTKATKTSVKKLEKKPGFLASTLTELKRVEWPSLPYVLRWTLVIILFTAAISLFLGFVDNIFTAGVKFVDCTTELTQGEPEDGLVGACGRDFLEEVTFQGN